METSFKLTMTTHCTDWMCYNLMSPINTSTIIIFINSTAECLLVFFLVFCVIVTLLSNWLLSLYPFLFAVLNFFPLHSEDECVSEDGRRVGACLNVYECRLQGGQARGECALGFGVCCICKFYLFSTWTIISQIPSSSTFLLLCLVLLLLPL